MIRQLKNPAGMGQQGGDIRRDEIALRRQADDQGAGVAHRDHLLRMLAAQHPQGVGTLQQGDGGAHGGQKIPVVVFFDQERHHLRIRFGQELHDLLHQLLFQRGVVFDDPVMYHREAAAGAAVGMGIFIAGLAVRGTTGMADAHGGLHPFAAADHVA